jgi:hypothetical protein
MLSRYFSMAHGSSAEWEHATTLWRMRAPCHCVGRGCPVARAPFPPHMPQQRTTGLRGSQKIQSGTPRCHKKDPALAIPKRSDTYVQ